VWIGWALHTIHRIRGTGWCDTDRRV